MHVGVLFRVQLLRPDRHVLDERVAHNLMTNSGLSVIAAAIAWSASHDVNAMLFGAATPLVIAPLYGAVGAGTAPAAVTDTQLTAEIGRAPIAQVTNSGTTATWVFQWGLSAAVGSISEVGLFGRASAGINSGTLLDHAIINPPVVKDDTNLLLYQATLTVQGD